MEHNGKYWLAFASLEKTSSTFTQRLYEHFLDIELAWQADVSELIKVDKITKKQLDNFLEERKKVDPDSCESYILNQEIDYITFDSSDYPEILKHIYNPPTTIFVQGDLTQCNLNKTLAVVGSRKASQNSKEVLTQIIYDLGTTDICIVSGLAAGIDTVAHNAALDSNLKTIAVLGGGFNHIYPKSNKGLFNRIKDGQGAVISEYWPTAEPISWRFPHRNRIVSGLSYGTLVAEAAIKSGALITAKLALEHGRELMCIPGLISNPNTEGIYKLLKDGASLVTSAEDVLDTLNWTYVAKQQSSNFETFKTPETHIETIVLSAIQRDSSTVDELLIDLSLNIADLMVILTKLEIRGLVKQIEGGKYISLAVI